MQESNFNVIIDSENYTTVIGESAKIDVGQAISNVQSGKAEIEAAVQDGKAAFNLNAAAKTQEFDDHVVDSLNEAKQWAIGEPEELAEGSSKYWAEQARYFSNNEWGKIIGILSNQTDLQEVLDAKQDAFSAGTALEFVGGAPQSVIGSEVEVIGEMNYLKALGKCVQNGTPSSANPVDILCNNGIIKAKDDELPVGYNRITQISFDSNTYYETNQKLYGTDTLTIRLSGTSSSGRNVIGAYSGTDAASRNFSLFIYGGGSSSNSYLRHGTNLGRPNYGTGTRTLVMTPTGTDGFKTDVTYPQETFETTDTFWIGGLPNSTSTKYDGNIIGNITVSDRLKYIPCERVSDGAIGYYETVNGEFLENQGEGMPVAGEYDTSHLVAYIDGTDESILINSLPSAFTVENLLGVGSVKDEQNLSTGEVIRRCAVTVYDGTQTIGQDYISSTGGLDIGAVVVYPLATPISESVSAQSLSLAVGDVLTTSGTASDLELEVNMDAGKALNFVNPGYQTSSDVTTAISAGVAGKQDNLTSANAGTGISITGSGSNVVISNTQTSAEWGNITGTLSDQTDLQTALSGKADVDMSNVNASGKSLISGLSMPSNHYEDLTFGASGTYYTAPANGWFLLYANTTSSNVWAQLVNLSKSDFVVRYSNNANVDFGLILPVNKNDVMLLQYTSVTLSQSWSKFRFYYAEGEPNV